MRDLRAGDCLFFTDWQGDADERLCPEGPTVGRAAGRRGPARRRRQGADVALPLAEAVLQRGGEPPARRRRRRRRAARCCSTNASAAAARTTRRWWCCAVPAATRRSSAASTCATAAATTHGTSATRSRSRWPRSTATTRRGTTPSSRSAARPSAALRHHLPAALGRPAFRRHRQPAVQAEGPAAPRRHQPRPAAPAAAGTRARRVVRGAGAPHLSRDPAAHALRADGERTVARGFVKALRRARRLVYLQDQYLWSPHIARVLAAALRAEPELHLVVVVRGTPTSTAASRCRPTRSAACRRSRPAATRRPDRVHVYDLENEHSTPVYVHAKVAVFDDVWATVGSANLNRRSWSHDSELTAAVLDDTRDTRDPVDPAGRGDGARVFARDLRLELMREHLDRAPGDDADLVDPATRWRPWRSRRRARPVAPRRQARPSAAGAVAHARPRTDAARDAPLGHTALPRGLRPGRPFGRPTGGAGVGELASVSAATSPPSAPPAASPPNRRSRSRWRSAKGPP